MSDTLQWGLDFIIAVQRVHGPVLDSIFRAITSMGNQDFCFMIVPLIFWCTSTEKGIHITILLTSSTFLSEGLKELFQQARPFEFDPTVKLAGAEGYGLPSHHAQVSVVMWGMIASWARKTWAWVAAIGLMILVGFSRIYLGLHFPTQVLAGWGVGAILLGFYLTRYVDVERWLAGRRLILHIMLVFLVFVVLSAIFPIKDVSATMAFLVGMWMGLALARGHVAVGAGGPLWQQAARFLVGVVILFAIYMGLDMVFPEEGESFYLILRSIRYGLMGAWISLGAPWLFRLLRLAPKAEQPA